MRERRKMGELSSMMENDFHPMQDNLTALGSSFNNRLLHPKCAKERYSRSFCPAAVRLYSTALIYTRTVQSVFPHSGELLIFDYVCNINILFLISISHSGTYIFISSCIY